MASRQTYSKIINKKKQRLFRIKKEKEKEKEKEINYFFLILFFKVKTSSLVEIKKDSIYENTTKKFSKVSLFFCIGAGRI
jgi:hypothetical protein